MNTELAKDLAKAIGLADGSGMTWCRGMKALYDGMGGVEECFIQTYEWTPAEIGVVEAWPDLSDEATASVLLARYIAATGGGAGLLMQEDEDEDLWEVLDGWNEQAATSLSLGVAVAKAWLLEIEREKALGDGT